MQFDYNRPIFLQIAQDIKREIAMGRLPPGSKLPAVSELSLRYAVNPNTIQHVYRVLDGEGIIYVKRGIGAFVTEDEALCAGLKTELVAELVRAFYEGMEKLGYSRAGCARILQNMEKGTN